MSTSTPEFLSWTPEARQAISDIAVDHLVRFADERANSGLDAEQERQVAYLTWFVEQVAFLNDAADTSERCN